jgi:hypothetical protein
MRGLQRLVVEYGCIQTLSETLQRELRKEIMQLKTKHKKPWSSKKSEAGPEVLA